MWLETAKQVTQLNRSPHLDKVSCTRTLKARYFSYGAAGRVLSWSKAKSRPYSKPYYLQGTGESLSSLLAHALVLQHIQVPQRTQTPLFQPILRASTFFPVYNVIYHHSLVWSSCSVQIGVHKDCSMRRHSRTPVNGKALHCSSRSGFRAQPAYLKQPGHLKHQRIPPPPAGQQLLVTADHL